MDFLTNIKPGIDNEIDDTVTEQNSASAWGSGGLPVFATPAMIAFMEKAAHLAVEALLPSGWSTVGTEVNIKHLSATPVGMKITARAELLSIEGRALHYKIEAHDEEGKIGEGTHSRFIIETEKFMARTEKKGKS